MKPTSNDNAKEKNQKILGQEIDDDELESVSGGLNQGSSNHGGVNSFHAEGPGNCTESFYIEQCTATVDANSWCLSDDFCSLISETYTEV